MRIDSNPQHGGQGQAGLDRAFTRSLIAAATRQYKENGLVGESSTSVNVTREIADTLLSLMGRHPETLPLVRECIDDALRELVVIEPRVLDALRTRPAPIDVLERVYRRGYALWETDMKIDKHQHAFNRVNSFVAGGKARVLDSDLLEYCGAGFMGTDKLAKKYARETPGQREALKTIRSVIYREKFNNG